MADKINFARILTGLRIVPGEGKHQNNQARMPCNPRITKLIVRLWRTLFKSTKKI